MFSADLFHALNGLTPEHQKLISRFGRGPSIPVPHDKVHEAFESIANQHPTAIAAKHNGKTITYGELDAAANRLANCIIDAGLAPKHRVCLVVQRSIEMLIGIFAILKAGCQYVPVDGGIVTDQTLRHILVDTNARFVLCLPRFEHKVRPLAGNDTKIVSLGTGIEDSYTAFKPGVSASSTDGVYAIYTSGRFHSSTGTPKGVDVSHGNVTNALLLQPGRLGIGVGSKVAQVLNIAFDMGAWEILGCLMNGGTLYMRGSSWEETLQEVHVLISTPSVLSKYRRKDFRNIKTVVTGGEPCPQSLADEWAEDTCYYNICGPTEITILNTAHRHSPGSVLTIGKPLPNTTVYVLDEDENPVPFGAKGSMWVGGAGVTRGYINLPELTSKRYKRDKFLDDGSVMFNTGDLVSWREDGSLNTFGRQDDQVKIKGFRVELDGVSAVIEKFPGITRACATVVDGALHGFYSTTTIVDEHDLEAFVKAHLPYYSVPSTWVYVPAVPLSPNGKVDKKQLATLARCASRASLPMSSTQSFNTKDLYIPAKIEKVYNNDPEKGESSSAVIISSSLSEFNVSTSSISDAPVSLPPKNGFHGQRWVRHRLFILYRRFFTVIVLANIGAACFILYRNLKEDRYILADVATATATNLCMAVLMRSEPVINLLFTIFCSVPTSWPLAIRRHCARIFHIGGIHSGCAIAAIVWFSIFTLGASLEFRKPLESRCLTLTTVVLTYLLWPMFVTIASLSHPSIRAKHHDLWEHSHRLGGWSALIILWVQTFLASRDLAVGLPPAQAWLHSAPVWLLTVTTMAIIFPWLFLRKVPVRSEVLSSHAVRLWFDHTTPVVGTSVRLSERPLGDWHGFATITNANGKGFSLVVSNAGDFTKRTISRAPTTIYIRGIPACGVLRIATLFKSVVLVATGSGIGPCLAVILAKKTPARILWTAPNPEQTFGKEIVDSVLDCDPKAVIHNTRTQGKPDMNLMAYRLWKESGAEAVCVISNKRFTTSIVYAMEARGIPAYGAIFDS